jgi:phosphoesterase RecJ-like protein
VKAQVEKFLQLIQTGQQFLLGCHVHPDGDAIGSVLALGIWLQNAGKQVEMLCLDGVPSVYRFLEGSSLMRTSLTKNYCPEVLICLDCAEKDRIALPAEIWDLSGLLVVNIDHHITNSQFGNLNLVDPAAAATGELVFRIIKQSRIGIDRAIATALYTAIATDTGFFRYDCTSAYTLETVSWLVKKYQVKPSKIAEQVHEQKSFNSIKLLGEILRSMQVGLGGKVAWIVLNQAMLQRYPVENEETESYVNFARSIEGVEIGLIFKELKPNEFKVSWRSTEAVDVSKLAANFGGGGHARAAGCNISGSVNDVVKLVLDYVSDFYRR